MWQVFFAGKISRLLAKYVRTIHVRRQVNKHRTDEWWVISVLPEDGDGVSPRNVFFKSFDVADRPRRLY
jgi:hypothetical protein